MATYDLTRGAADGGLNADTLDRVGVLRRRVEMSEVNAGAGAAAGDVLQVIDIPAGFRVIGAFYSVVTAEGAAATFDLGDGADPDGYFSNVDANATGTGSMNLALVEGAPNTVSGYSAGKYYSAADTIDIIADAAMDAAVIEVAVLVVQLDTQAAVR